MCVFSYLTPELRIFNIVYKFKAVEVIDIFIPKQKMGWL